MANNHDTNRPCRVPDLRLPLSLSGPMTTGDSEPPEHVWDAVRKAKERKMAVSPSKIKSLERGRSTQVAGVPLEPSTQSTKRVPSPAPPLRQRPTVEFKESADGTRVTAKFDIPDVEKENMNVTYHPFPARLEISWKTVRVMDREVEECMTVREEESICRTILLPEGTRFDEIDAKLRRRLEVTYPKVRASQARPRAPTPLGRGAPRYGGSESQTLDVW